MADVESATDTCAPGSRMNQLRLKAHSARAERVRLENKTKDLAHRVHKVEAEVRGKIGMKAELLADADKRVTELLWEAEALDARDGNIKNQLENLKVAIVERKKLVIKELSSLDPATRILKRGAQHFRLCPTDDFLNKNSPRARAKDDAKLPSMEKGKGPEKWQEEIRKRAEERAARESRLRERTEELRSDIRGGNDFGATPHEVYQLHLASAGEKAAADQARNPPRTPRVTREAWLRAYAEENNADLEKRILAKEEELRQLEAGILKNREKLEARLKIIDKKDSAIGRPTHRKDRVARERSNIAGTREMEYLQEALRCIPPLSSTATTAFRSTNASEMRSAMYSTIHSARSANM